jgi:hypothetical protein
MKSHGQYLNPVYAVWKMMRQRCNNPRHKQYPEYGGRGIRVCARWEVFENFATDMGPRPPGDYSVERVDNDGDYEPQNCVWGTRVQQNNNSRHNRLVAFGGKTQTAAQWAKELGISGDTLRARLSRMSVERALTMEKGN